MSEAPLGHAEIRQQRPADACLHPLLSALDWTGEARHLYDALPEQHVITDFAALTAVLDRLDYRLIKVTAGAADLDDDALPALLLTADDDIWVILRKADAELFYVFQGRKALPAIVEQSALAGKIFHVCPNEGERALAEPKRLGWISQILHHERRQIWLLFVVTFLINCFALALPIYLMAVYDFAIGRHSVATLATLAGMIAVIIGAEIALRELRARAIARLAIRAQTAVIAAVFERLMRLPASYIENASVAGQLNRLRMFESLRDVFSGPLAASLLDLPFIFIFVAAVFAIGGSLGWLLVGFIGVMGLLGAVCIPRARAGANRAGAARSETRAFRMDLTRFLATIRDSGAEQIWSRRYRDLIGRQLSTAAAAQEVSFTEQTLAQGFSAITGALIVGYGALEVIDGTLFVGALTAVMAIVWRVLSPIQTAFLNVTRLFRAMETVRQVNQLMKLRQEGGSASRASAPQLRGNISLENVGVRLGTFGLPILRGIDLSIQAGEFIVLAGAPGPSRSALLKLIANLHQPSFGRIRIDGGDVRQFDVRELRRSAALVSDEQILFSGTLAQNLLLGNPLAKEHHIRLALSDADLADYADQLPEGIHTDLTDMLRAGMNAAIAQKIKLARAYIQSPSIYLLDEPSKDLDRRGQAALIDKLRRLKGTATIVVRTAHDDIVGLADRVAHLWAGQLLAERPAAAAAPAAVRPASPKDRVSV